MPSSPQPIRVATPAHKAAAVRHLKRADPVMARIIAAVGPCRYAARVDATPFEFIIRAIIYQQLSTRAAATIHARFSALFSGKPEAGAVMALGDATIRGAGISPQKLRYLRDLCAHVQADALPLDRLESMTDDEVAAALTMVKGIGRWSAQIFLMFRLGRLDVLPELDLGIRKAVQRAYRTRALPSPERVMKIGRPWSPYGTIAAWYLWRSLDGPAAV